MTGTLYLVATPIGNLEDITLRALRILREVHLIAAEDTRRTRNLLHHFEIRTRLVSYHDHSPPSRLQMLLAKLLSGESIAQVTDAGTPLLSDPGYSLVKTALENGIKVEAVPGPSALLAALCVSGLQVERFVFEGFLPSRRPARQAAITRLRAEPRAVVFYEAPHRLFATLKDLHSLLGPRQIIVARELTKLHEEVWRGTLAESLERWKEGARGEIVLVLAGAKKDEIAAAELEAHSSPSTDGSEALSSLAELIAAGMSRRDAARVVALRGQMPYREAYRQAMVLAQPDSLVRE